ncbi:MAG: 3-methylitaconate isomerase [Deltaproteobacteria bacterium]|jgi:2-methylaconitate cis-trans-isomerase PrpF|nr:3-methylitaconate isomerase [Deltaproteobacteria bacterium]
MPEQRSIPCVIARGGTSKGIYIKANHLPQEPVQRDKAILAIFGSPDIRQIDGLGGADPLTSKLAIIGPPSRSDADVDYTFGQVSFRAPVIDYSGNCGNISSGVGPFSIDEGLVKAVEPVTIVRIHNTNTGKLIVAEVPVKDGRAEVYGDCAIDGVPGTGARIMLDFADTAGSATGKLLPTGHLKETLATKYGAFEVSLVDCANAMVFVKAQSLDLKGIEGPKKIDGDKALLDRLEAIRGAASVALGFSQTPEEALIKNPAFPMLAVVSPPADYLAFGTGVIVKADSISFVARNMFMQVLHKTYAGTGSVCTAVAACIPGTVVNEVCATHPNWGSVINIGHPSGIISVEAVVVELEVKRAAFPRTARRIMEGRVLIP